MRNIHLSLSKKPVRLGSALAWFIVFVVVVIAVVVTQRVMKATAKDPDTCLDLEPWKEWKLRESSTDPKPLQGTSEEQPDITKGLQYDVNVTWQNESRGELFLIVQSDGMVYGGWSGHYHKEQAKLTIDVQDGAFTGYVCPLKIYQDENGRDPSKLYFIANGSFLIHEYDMKSKYRIVTGDLYVTGWIEADYTVSGNVIITSDGMHFETYDYTAYSPVRR